MKADCPVIEFTRKTFSSAQKIKGGKSPVFAWTNFRPGVALAFIRRPHGQQVFYCNFKNRFFAALNFIIGKIIQNFVVNAFDLPFIDCNSDKQGYNALCGGHYMGAIVLFIIVPAIGVNKIAVLNCRNLADIGLLLFYKIISQFKIDFNSFR